MSEIIKAVYLVNEIYSTYGTGDHCHIVIDDGNIQDECVDSCLNRLYKNTEYPLKDKSIQIQFLLLFKTLSLKDRELVLHLTQYITNEEIEDTDPILVEEIKALREGD